MNGCLAVVSGVGSGLAVIAAAAAIAHTVVGAWPGTPDDMAGWMGIMVAASIAAIFVITKVVCWICDREDDQPYDVENVSERGRRKNLECGLAGAADLRSGGEIVKRGRSGTGTCGARN